jgi:hypothetical protein
MIWIRKIAEYILVIPTLFPFLLKMSGIVGLTVGGILFFGVHVGGASSEAYNINLPLEKQILFGSIFLVCSLPWLAILSIHLMNYIEKSNIKSNPHLMDEIKQKFYQGGKLDNVEVASLTNDIRSRIKLKADVLLQEEAFYILQDESQMEHFLYELGNERVSQMLEYLSESLNDSDFKGLIVFVIATIPNKFEMIIRKGMLSQNTLEKIANRNK